MNCKEMDINVKRGRKPIRQKWRMENYKAEFKG